MTNNDVLEQAQIAMELVKEIYPNEDHVFVYDNATTHLKRPDGAHLARKMPMKPKEWLVEVPKCDAETGKPIASEKELIQMEDGYFGEGDNRKTQSFYFPEDHEKAGEFKGTAQILRERGFTPPKYAKCKGFKCKPPAKDCCCHQLLFNQPNFTDVKSKLEILGNDLGVPILFLPKYHCELNFIEQCWGYAKQVYRPFEESSKDDPLEQNTLEALESIPLVLMRR
jgi:hypothetical protein